MLLLVSTILNFLLLSRVLKGLYRLYTVLPIQLLTLLLLTLHFPYVTFTVRLPNHPLPKPPPIAPIIFSDGVIEYIY